MVGSTWNCVVNTTPCATHAHLTYLDICNICSGHDDPAHSGMEACASHHFKLSRITLCAEVTQNALHGGIWADCCASMCPTYTCCIRRELITRVLWRYCCICIPRCVTCGIGSMQELSARPQSLYNIHLCNVSLAYDIYIYHMWVRHKI